MTSPETAADLSPPRFDAPPPLARGLTCPACNRDRLSVFKTRRAPGRVVRVRLCLDCGRRFRTAERVESVRA